MSERDLSVSIPDPQDRGVLVDFSLLVAGPHPAPEPEPGVASTRAASPIPEAAPTPAPAPVPASAPAATATATATHAETWCRVRVHGPSGPLDMSMPTARSVGDLVAELTTRLLPGAPLDAATWRLHRLGDPPLDPGSSFGRAAPRDGEDFHLDAAPIAGPARRAARGWITSSPTAMSDGWSAGSMTVATGAVTIAASTLLSFVFAVTTPRAVALPLLVAAGLLAATSLVSGGSADIADDEAPTHRARFRGLAAAAALPAWAAAGLALAQGVGGGWSSALAFIGLALVIGAAASALAVPSLTRVWAGPATSGLLIATGGTLAASGVSDEIRAAAVFGTVAFLLLASIPGLSLLAQGASPPGSAPPEGAGLSMWGHHVGSARTAVSISMAASVSVCAAVLASRGGPSALWLAAALSIALAARARHSRLVLESGAMLVLGLVALGYVTAVGIADAGTVGGIAATALVVVVLVASLLAAAVMGRARDGIGAAPNPLHRPWVRRSLDAVEAVTALAVLPLVWLVMKP